MARSLKQSELRRIGNPTSVECNNHFECNSASSSTGLEGMNPLYDYSPIGKLIYNYTVKNRHQETTIAIRNYNVFKKLQNFMRNYKKSQTVIENQKQLILNLNLFIRLHHKYNQHLFFKSPAPQKYL